MVQILQLKTKLNHKSIFIYTFFCYLNRNIISLKDLYIMANLLLDRKVDTKFDTTDIVAKNIRVFTAYTGMKVVNLATALQQHKSNTGRKFNGKAPWSMKDIDILCDLFGLEPYDFFMERPDITKINVDKVKQKSAPGGVRTHDQRIMSPLL